MAGKIRLRDLNSWVQFMILSTFIMTALWVLIFAAASLKAALS